MRRAASLPPVVLEQDDRRSVIVGAVELPEAEFLRDAQRPGVLRFDDAGLAEIRLFGVRPGKDRADEFACKPLAMQVGGYRPAGFHRAFQAWREVALEVVEPRFADQPAARSVGHGPEAEAHGVPHAGVAKEAYPGLLA